MSFVAPEQVKFRYKLEGYDNEWQDAGNRRQAIYTNLPPRAYRFRLMASNNSGVWNEEGALLDFSIAPAFYQTTWFRLAILVLFLFLLLAGLSTSCPASRAPVQYDFGSAVSERLRIARAGYTILCFRVFKARCSGSSRLRSSCPSVQMKPGIGLITRFSRRLRRLPKVVTLCRGCARRPSKPMILPTQ